MKIELTDSNVKTLPVPKTGWKIYRDSKLPGLGVRVLAKTGTAAWVVDYVSRTTGRRHIYTLGLCAELKAARARAMAKDLKAKVKHNNHDPAEDHREIRETPSVDDLLDAYLDSIKSLPSHYDTKNAVEHDLRPALGRYKVTDPNLPKYIAKLHETVTARCRTGRRANMVVQIAFRAFRHGEIEPNPAANIDLNQENTRERVLSLEELRKVWAAAETIGYPFGRLVQLLILTAQRRSEIAKLSWAEIDMDNAEINLPPSRTKNRRPHTVPLSPEAVRILKEIGGSDLVFPANIAGKFSYGKEQMDRLAPIAKWTVHDLRRSTASHMGDDDLNIDPLVIEKLLNHHGILKGVAAIYQRQKLKRKLRSAVECWERYLLNRGAEIIPIERRA